MNVKVTVGLAGDGFAFSPGQIVDRDLLASLVGADSYKNVSVEIATDDPVIETAEKTAVLETATRNPSSEKRGRKK